MQLRTPYKSPYTWYELIARLLEKVIKDEEEYNKRHVLKFPVSATSLRSHQQSLEHERQLRKRAEKPPSKSPVQKLSCANVFNQYRHQRDIKSVENLTQPTKNIMESTKCIKVLESQFIECPSYGWEEPEKDGVQADAAISFKKTNGETLLPCSQYPDSMQFVQCPSKPVTLNIQTIPTKRLSIGTLTNNVSTQCTSTQTHDIKSDKNKLVQCVQESDIAKSISGIPTTVTVLTNSSLEAYFHPKVLLLSVNPYSVLHTHRKYIQDVQTEKGTKNQGTTTLEFKTAEAQCSRNNWPVVKQSKMTSVQCPSTFEQGTSSKDLVRNTLMSDMITMTINDSNETTTNDCRCSDVQVQCKISQPSKCVQELENVPKMNVSTCNNRLTPAIQKAESKEALTKCYFKPDSSILDIDKMTDVCTNETCVSEISKAMKEDVFISSIILDYLDKLLHLDDKLKIRAAASFIRKKILLMTDIQPNDRNCLSYLEQTKFHDAVFNLTKTFLEILERALNLDTEHIIFASDLQILQKCKCTLNAHINDNLELILTKIESCLFKMLEADKFADTCPDKHIKGACLGYCTLSVQDQSSSKFKSLEVQTVDTHFTKSSELEAEMLEIVKLADTGQNKCAEDLCLGYCKRSDQDQSPSKVNFVEMRTLNTHLNKSTEIEGNAVLTDSVSFLDNKDYRDYQYDTTFLKPIIEEERLAENKQVRARSGNWAIGIDGSLSRIFSYDKGSRFIPTSLAGVINVPHNSHRKINMARQKRTSVVKRVIRCNNEHKDQESDKQAFDPDTDVNVQNKTSYPDAIKTGNTCNANTCNRTSVPIELNIQNVHPRNTSKVPVNHGHVERKNECQMENDSVTESLNTVTFTCSYFH